METLQAILDLLGVVALGWLATAVMFRLMGGPIPWPYPRRWRWGSATLEAAYALPDDPVLRSAHGVSESLERRLARVDWLDYDLRRN
ncbi:MAG: hypothetical protein HY616_06100 [Candidatus Rokubacteria bacterium]|nr:hypothetical protein [Candidatus Rokubacteria bacterium]